MEFKCGYCMDTDPDCKEAKFGVIELDICKIGIERIDNDALITRLQQDYELARADVLMCAEVIEINDDLNWELDRDTIPCPPPVHRVAYHPPYPGHSGR